ncbi:uncharacterized protein LOC125246858 [Megalobrama amblycephala]|uniref:uncharacterized protein LOC125246858 n=1 Tax=Megalobrama amblycephala TaxID=75352 RepID=UPI0020140158|nr:uncharacterized protein LOC125246858 [Megalobrama amblycephala]
MKLMKTKSNWLLILIIAFHITSSEASHDDDVRILIVGIRGDSRFSAADILSGRTDGGQEDREIVKTPVITDEGRRMMLVTGPNLCEEDTARQSFTTALFLSSPGPHAVLMVLNLEDEESEQCDVVKRAQELLGAEVLQYCIVLLHQERFTGASRGIAGEMIDACGGRFHMIRDSEPDQTAALVEIEIDKLVWLNGDGFYSVLNETQQLEAERLELLKRLKEIEKIFKEKANQYVSEENPLPSVSYDSSGGTAGIVTLIFLVSFIAFVVHREARHKYLNFGAKFAALVLLMVYLRHVLSPYVAVPLNLALITSLAAVLTDPTSVTEQREFSESQNIRDVIGNITVYFATLLKHYCTLIMHLSFIQGSALIFGTIISVRSWSDVLIACYAAPGVTAGAYAFIFQHENIGRKPPVFALVSFLYCSAGATLSVVFLKGLGVTITIILLITGFKHHVSMSKTQWKVICLTVSTLVLLCGFALLCSVSLILGTMTNLNSYSKKLVTSTCFM